ncbi:MAG: efflux RND transporter periplasmic adaptor subunit [Pseudanabaenaceae cyanobacterium bins.68]|nr:efflux RND transporter periplasmic adaptor subunit [Pseudanabaenaceae cyanobacterium bins.68]
MKQRLIYLGLCGCLGLVSACGGLPNSNAQPVSPPRPVNVDVESAKLGQLQPSISYVGTTAPQREVTVRSRLEGRLVSLAVDVGDRVNLGQAIAQQDDLILRAAVTQAQSELAARQAEVVRARTQIKNAEIQVEDARLKLRQAQADARRLQQLNIDGAIAKQAAEQAQTNASTAAQTLRAAIAQVQSQESELGAAQRRQDAQVAILAQAQERLTYTQIKAPVTGLVLSKASEPGNLLQPGNEVIKIGDFSRVKVVVQLSELDRSQIQLGQKAIVQLDAQPNQEISAQVSRISPAADPTTRLIPVELSLANPQAQIGSGLLARVRFASAQPARVVIPQGALRLGRSASQNASSQAAKVYVVKQTGKQTQAIARQVQLGNQADGKIEVLAGLQPGERFITRVGGRLQDGDPVTLSILSQNSKPQRRS